MPSRVAASTLVALVLALAAPPCQAATAGTARAAAPVADHEMPFPCGEAWTGTTRGNHSPSSLAIDWNRADDLGAPVVASAPGVVTTARTTTSGGYGRYVVIDHGNGEDSLYAHLSAVTVTVGQRVDQGMLIGRVGSSGNSTGPHLHFEERKLRKVVQPYLHRQRFVFGTTPRSSNCVDVPLAADWYGYGRGRVAVYRRAAKSQFRIQRAGQDPVIRVFGTSTDEPVVGNWDGAGGANVGVFSPATATFRLKTPAGTQSIVFGVSTDKPVAGDWDGNGKWEIGVWRASTATFRLRAANGRVTSIRLGDRNDLPVLGDWDADGTTDLGVYDATTASFTLRKVDEEGTVWLGSITFGKRGDLPVAADWDGNGRTDLGVWTPSTGVFTQRIASTPTAPKARTLTTIRFGRVR